MWFLFNSGSDFDSTTICCLLWFYVGLCKLWDGSQLACSAKRAVIRFSVHVVLWLSCERTCVPFCERPAVLSDETSSMGELCVQEVHRRSIQICSNARPYPLSRPL